MRYTLWDKEVLVTGLVNIKGRGNSALGHINPSTSQHCSHNLEEFYTDKTHKNSLVSLK